MVIVHITAFFICLLVLSYFWKESLVETAPVLTCMLVLTLYALAFFHRLDLIDGIGVLVIVLFLCWLVSRKREQRADFGQSCLQNVISTSFITAALLLFAVILCTSQKAAAWWDDINFWMADVKSLYYLNGFAEKYGNVVPEYGDYPPGGQLLKWWFLHFDPLHFREGLAFAGYYFMNLVFMLPLFRKMEGKNVLVMAGMAAALWLLPGIAEVYGYDGFCADLTLACIYGGFLFAVIDREGKKDSFYYGRLMLYLSVLVLMKSVGFIWALFGLIFLAAYQAGRKTCEEKTGSADRTGRNKARITGRLRLLAVCAAPFITGGSWMLFCLMMRRVTRTTATAVKYMTTDEYGISGYTADFAKAFLEAFAVLPLHKNRTPVIDLTPLGFYLCICLLVVFFYQRDIMPKRQGRLVLWFSIASGALFYGIIFIAHITIFATETQYLEASGMISSIERYGAPFTVGTLLFLANIWIDCGGKLFAERAEAEARLRRPGLSALIKRPFLQKYGTCLVLILFVALTAEWRTGYHGLIGYRAGVQEQLAGRAAMIDEDAALFLEKAKALGTGQSTRICYIQRDDEPRWVRNSYTSLEASPISVVYRAVNLDDAVTDWMTQEIRDSHAEYLYVEKTDADAAKVFNIMTDSGAFSCEVLYRIEDDGVRMRLTEVR
ncbi:MAG: hypothetical protein NC341_05720 [Blautia sp.]|nr:hypothetical protein [Blautia sp.]MCM1200010.1 hypothetical protein [Bacteroides fragilis]